MLSLLARRCAACSISVGVAMEGAAASGSGASASYKCNRQDAKCQQKEGGKAMAPKQYQRPIQGTYQVIR
jgi:hypothetical protein